MSPESVLDVPPGAAAVPLSVLKVRDDATIEAIRLASAPVASTATVAPALFPRLAAALAAAQPTFRSTGRLHAAAPFDLEGRLLVLREDVGRHNAVDKVVGHMVRIGNFPLADCILVVSGRASFEIMQKARRARIPIVAAVSAPSSMAVQMARAADITLVGFLRGGGFTVYAGAHRVTTAVLEPA